MFFFFFFFWCLLLQLQFCIWFFWVFSLDETAPDQTSEAKFYSVPNSLLAPEKSHHLSTEFCFIQALNTCKKTKFSLPGRAAVHSWRVKWISIYWSDWEGSEIRTSKKFAPVSGRWRLGMDMGCVDDILEMLQCRRAREMLGGGRKMGKMDHLVWFNTGTKGLKGRKWIKTLWNKIILFLPRTWNSLLNRIEMSLMSFELHLGLTFHSFPPMSFVLVSTDIPGCFPSFFFPLFSFNNLL